MQLARRICNAAAVALLGTVVAVALAGAEGSTADPGLPLTIVSQTASAVTVKWTPPQDIVGYEFKVDGVRVSNTWDASRAQVKFGIRDSQVHNYEVVSIVEGNIGDLTLPPPPAVTTAPTTTNTAPPPPTSTSSLSPPPAPAGLTATAGDGSVTLTWQPEPAAEQIDSYQVYAAAVRNVLDIPATQTSYTVGGLTNGTQYSFRVSAHNAAGYGPWNAVAVTATPAGTTTTTTLSVAPTWNGDFSTGNLSQWGGWEYVGTFNGNQPPISDRVTVAPSIDGIAAPSPLKDFARITVKPGDQYGSSTGWRTLARMYDPIRFIPQGEDDWFVWEMIVPAGYPGDANVWVNPVEVHQTKAPYVTVTGVAPAHIIAGPNAFSVDVAGGRDGGRIVSVNQQVLAGYPRGVPLVFAMRYKSDPSNGAFELWEAQVGHGPVVPLIQKTGISTEYEQTQNYLEWGLYRAQTGTSTTTTYLGGVREYASRDAALAYADTLAAG